MVGSSICEQHHGPFLSCIKLPATAAGARDSSFIPGTLTVVWYCVIVGVFGVHSSVFSFQMPDWDLFLHRTPSNIVLEVKPRSTSINDDAVSLSF